VLYCVCTGLPCLHLRSFWLQLYLLLTVGVWDVLLLYDYDTGIALQSMNKLDLVYLKYFLQVTLSFFLFTNFLSSYFGWLLSFCALHTCACVSYFYDVGFWRFRVFSSKWLFSVYCWHLGIREELYLCLSLFFCLSWAYYLPWISWTLLAYRPSWSHFHRWAVGRV